MLAESRILTGEPTTPLPRLPGGDVYRLWPLFFVAGAVFTMVGWAEVLLVWIPLRFGNAEWEFSVVSRTFDLLPLGTVGLTLMSAALIARGGHPWPVRALAVIFFVLMVISVICSALYIAHLPDEWARTALPNVGSRRAIVKTICYMVAFTVAYAAAGQVLWRTAKESDPLR